MNQGNHISPESADDNDHEMDISTWHYHRENHSAYEQISQRIHDMKHFKQHANAKVS